MRKRAIVNIIEIDSRDSRYQTGIERYLNVLRDNMPENIFTFRIIFYRISECRAIKLNITDNELSIIHPIGFPTHTLYSAIISMIGARINGLQNLIVKSNCLGFEGLAYAIRANFYCHTVGVLHCVPKIIPGAPISNPLFNMDHIITVCDTSREWLNAVGNTRPVTTIFNGIERPKISAGKSDNTFRFIFANGWAKHKGFEKIIPAIRHVAARRNIEVIVLGGFCAEDDTNLFNEIADLPIRRVGLIDYDKVQHYYQNADCALFASVSEACSFAGIEAMAYKLPVISTNAPGLVEMFGPHGALYIKHDTQMNINAEEYASAMMQVIDNRHLRTKLSVAAYSRYLQKYTARDMVRQTIDLYNKLIRP